MQGKFISDNTVSERQMPVLTNMIDTRLVEQAVLSIGDLSGQGGVALFATRHCYLVSVLLFCRGSSSTPTRRASILLLASVDPA